MHCAFQRARSAIFNSSPPLRYSELLAAQKIRLSCLAEKGLRDSCGDFDSRTLLVRGPEMLLVNGRSGASSL